MVKDKDNVTPEEVEVAEVKPKTKVASVTPEFIAAKRRDAEILQIKRRGGLV